MSAAAEQTLFASLADARRYREYLRVAKDAERIATIQFMNEALLQRWAWPRIGDALGISATAARRYYERNKRDV